MFETNNHEEIILSGVLAEFRIALREEIDETRRSASSTAVPLANGRCIARLGGSYQYIFDIENVLNLPGDAPGDLYVPNHQPLEISVISVDGMTITLSVPIDLGNFVPNARLQSNLVHLMRKLIERIEGMVDTANPSGDRILKGLSSGEPVLIKLPMCNSDQRDAIASSLGRNTTFIWGPPGTGKTRTIGFIGEQLYRQGRSLLLVSHTNIAVDGALLQIANALDKTILNQGHVIRVGVPKDQHFHNREELLLSTHVDKRSDELTSLLIKLNDDRSKTIKEIEHISRIIDICEWVIEAKNDISSMSKDLGALHKMEANLKQSEENYAKLIDDSEKWITASAEAQKAKAHIKKIISFDEDIAKLKQVLLDERRDFNKITRELKKAAALLKETSSVGWLIRRWRRLPSPEEQLAVVEAFQSKVSIISDALNEANHKMEIMVRERAELQIEIDTFEHKYSCSPDDVLIQAETHALEQIHLQNMIIDLNKQCFKNRAELESLFRSRLIVLIEWNLIQKAEDSAEVMLAAIETAHSEAAAETNILDLHDLRAEHDQLNTHIRALDIEIREIEKTLKHIEDLVIADAKVVATTLTQAYLRDSIQSRRFDTVILDEASMAPIPALWIAAGLADINVVVVGDFMQLPPIVLSNHKLALNWLGKDIFDVAELSNLHSTSPVLIKLTRQYRMHPYISAIPNRFFYENQLINDDETLNDKSLDGWYQHKWGYDNPVILIDTGSVGAWVTSVPGAGRSSRLNFLSATICVDLAEKLLCSDRPELSDTNLRRILIVCPYRPHARLLRLLLDEQSLTGDVWAGTAHSFQGSQADVVILDLVNDEPHWKVAMFMPSKDESTTRLLNVALTRARRRLFIVGDFNYIIKQAKKAFLGAELIPFLQENYPLVDARDIVLAGLAARAAKAQSAIFGGEIEPDAARIVLTQEKFSPILRADFARAYTRIIIYSAFITQDRLSWLQPPIRAAIERGVRVYVVTKTHSERRKFELSQYRMLERALTEWGIVVIHKRGMHEKLVFIDDDILWTSSLNQLSFRDTQEILERRVSKKVVKDYERTIRLNELISEYDSGQPRCPICGKEVVASEGKDDPFYWRCVEDNCYSRSYNQPPLQDGIITCANCGGDVEFGEWGNSPAWRCLKNRRHHQRVARTHLRLPKMRAIISKKKLGELDKRFGLQVTSKSNNDNNSQKDLFS